MASGTSAPNCPSVLVGVAWWLPLGVRDVRCAAMWQRRALVVLVVVVGGIVAYTAFGLANRECTLADCGGSEVIVDLGQGMEDGVEYEIELCLDDACWNSTGVFEDGVSQPPGEPLHVESSGMIHRWVQNDPDALPSDISVVVWADGEEIVRHSGKVVFEAHRPNGPGCPPVCYIGEVVI